MLWHAQNNSPNGLVRHPWDSKAWKHINERFPALALNVMHVHLGFIANGVNMYKLNSSTWSTWHVILFNYNIPPSLTTKKFFVMLALLIPRKELITSNNFDLYLQHVVEELQQLWEGVRAYDVLNLVGLGPSHLEVFYFGLHDFLGYGCVDGVAH
jgi:hypothetical protein